MSGWRAIDSAPTDGTPIDIWVLDENMDEGGQRFPDMFYREGGPGESNDWESLDGMLALSDCGYHPNEVTHWMPRPAPPAGQPTTPEAT